MSDADLRALLPSKAETDELMEIYLDNYGALYHVIHLPTFWEAYNKIWPDISNANPHQVALVLVMIAAAQCLTTAQPWLYMANSSTAREKAVANIQAVDDWLLAQSQKHVAALDFQIRVVLLLAKQVAARKSKRTWAYEYGVPHPRSQWTGKDDRPQSEKKLSRQCEMLTKHAVQTLKAERWGESEQKAQTEEDDSILSTQKATINPFAPRLIALKFTFPTLL